MYESNLKNWDFKTGKMLKNEWEGDKLKSVLWKNTRRVGCAK